MKFEAKQRKGEPQHQGCESCPIQAGLRHQDLSRGGKPKEAGLCVVRRNMVLTEETEASVSSSPKSPLLALLVFSFMVQNC